MEAVFENKFWNLQIHLSFFICHRIESRTSKNSDELRVSIEKAYVVARVKKSIIWVSSDKNSTTSYSS